MEPFLLPGDRLYVDTRAFDTAPPARGDVVVLHDPEESTRLLVKRVAALPGDIPAGALDRVPSGHLYVLGDRGADSRDSRQFGPVPLVLVVGLARFRYSPPDRRGPLGDRILK